MLNKSRRFTPITPRNLDAALAGRIGDHRVLTYDRGSLERLPSPHGDGRTFYYTRSDWSEGVSWVRFTVNGQTFARRAREVQGGNFGVTWVKIGGVEYQIHEE